MTHLATVKLTRPNTYQVKSAPIMCIACTDDSVGNRHFCCSAGVGLFPTGALINHSCTPNAMQSFRQQQVTFKALQPIVPGAEITISYIELAATHAERRQQLSEQYYFDNNHDLQVISNIRHAETQTLTCYQMQCTHAEKVVQADTQVRPKIATSTFLQIWRSMLGVF